MASTAASTGAAPASGGVTTQMLGGQSAPHASPSLYVGDLLPEVTEALLFETFNAVGPVASVRVCRDAATRRSLGYAYVNFHRADDAERALDTMNFKAIRGKACRIMWSHRDPSLRKSGQGNIFVKNLAKSIDNKQLYDTFSVFGNILSCKVAVNAKGVSLGYGFVHYETDESAAQAIARVDGKVIAGETVSVASFKSKKERGGVNKTRFTNLFVKRLPADYSEGALKELFGKYGTVTSIMLSAESKAPRPKKAAAGATTEAKEVAPTPEKFGFVNFQSPEEATAALDALNNFEIAPGKHLYVGRAQKREEREKELREKFEALKVERQKKYAGVNLYIKNLTDDIDDDRLRAEFVKFGAITSARVMKDDASKKSRGFGFVCFSTPDEATKAVTEMNGRMLDGKPLYVALAQRKEQRRQQLEARHQARAKGMPMGPQMGYPPQNAIFYQQPRGGATYMYPGPMGRGGWMGPMPGGPMGVAAQRGPMAYQLMPVPGGRGAPVPGGPHGVQAGAGSPQGGRPRVGPTGQPGGPRGGPQGGAGPQGGRGGGRGMPPSGGAGGMPGGAAPAGMPGVRLNENVRNPAAARPAIAPASEAPEAAVGPAPVAGGTQPLTLKALAAAPEKQKKQLIGEQLFPLVKAREPALAGKITGMLLEMDNHELIHLLESMTALNDKIQEAVAVLQAAEEEEETE